MIDDRQYIVTENFVPLVITKEKPYNHTNQSYQLLKCSITLDKKTLCSTLPPSFHLEKIVVLIDTLGRTTLEEEERQKRFSSDVILKPRSFFH